MKKVTVLVLAAIAALSFWRRRQPSAPTNRERLRARASELAVTERARAGRAWQGIRDRTRREP